MNSFVSLKGTSNGIILYLDNELFFGDLKRYVAEKITESSKFLGSMTVALKIEGRKLSEEEERDIIKVIEENSSLTIACIIDSNPDTSKEFEDAVRKVSGYTPVAEAAPDSVPSSAPASASVQAPTSASVQACASVQTQTPVQAAAQKVPEYGSISFFKGNLRSGQELAYNQSIVVLGDINPGAGITSEGNIIVLGSLRGTAFAGASGNENAFVFALDMSPMQIRIANSIARSSDKPEPEEKKEPKICFLEDGNIYIEKLTKQIINDLKI